MDALATVEGTARVADPRGGVPQVHAQPSHHAEHVRAVAAQLAEGAAQAQNRAVELRLNPEELGRVRLALHTGDGVITVAVTAERPETLDLMRRNISQLAQEFQDIGYGNVNFSFGGFSGQSGQSGDRNTDTAAPNDSPSRGAAPASTASADAPARPPIYKSTGLDLRL